MARFLFAAHDPGGAHLLSAVAPLIRARGHEIVFAAAGPTARLWTEAGFAPQSVAAAAEIDADGIDAVATGTGFGDFERGVWLWARERGWPTLAAIDAWTSLARRFQTDAGPVEPDAVAVLDTPATRELEALNWWRARLITVGQPHLEAQTAALAARRAELPGHDGPPRIVFFSEPVREDYGTTRGFDQFEVFAGLMVRLPSAWRIDLTVKPHPREDWARWQKILPRGVELAEAATPELLIGADGAVGMTTMVLIEAHLLGLPVLSLQPARTGNANPLVDDIGTPVLRWQEFAAAWRDFHAAVGRPQPVAERFGGLLDRAAERLADAIEATRNA